MREFEGAALIARRRYPRFAMRPTDRSLPCCSVLVRRLVRPRRRAVACTRSDRTGQCRPPVFRAFMTLGFFTLVRVTLIIKDRRYSTQVLCKRLSANRPTGARWAVRRTDCGNWNLGRTTKVESARGGFGCRGSAIEVTKLFWSHSQLGASPSPPPPT